MKLSAARPISAGNFSSSDYEDAKRRVKRLSAATLALCAPSPDQSSVDSGSNSLPPPSEVSRSRTRPASAPRARGGGRSGVLPAQQRIAPSAGSGVRLSSENEDSNKQPTLEVNRNAREVRREVQTFMDTLCANIRDLKDSITMKLESSPQMKKMLDADFKELELHLERYQSHIYLASSEVMRMQWCTSLERNFMTCKQKDARRK